MLTPRLVYVHADAGGPVARWWHVGLGQPHAVPVETGGHRTFRRDDFGDDAVSRSGVTFWSLGGSWSVSNHSRTMSNVFVLDPRFGRRPVPPQGSLALAVRNSWLLLPSVRGSDRPHVVTLILARQPEPQAGLLGVAPAVVTTGVGTAPEGEPTGEQLAAGLGQAARVLADSGVRDLIATYARPYFTVSTADPAPFSRKQVTTCLPGDEKRADRALQKLRRALWSYAEGQSPAIIVRILIRYGLITHREVAAVVHDERRCGHQPSDIDPTMPR